MTAFTTGRAARARLLVIAVIAALAALPAAAAATGKKDKSPSRGGPLELTVLHANDGESKLIDAGVGLEQFGGAARFKTVVDRLEDEALRGDRRRDCARGRGANRGAKGRGQGRRAANGRKGRRARSCSDRPRRKGVVTISSGDNFLAGPEFNASLERGVPFFDTVALDLIGFDASAIGNHEFDFGPDVLADFIDGFTRRVPFLSANLSVAREPRLAELAEERRIAPSAVIRERGHRIGIVGATTPDLRSISSPRKVVVDPDVRTAVQRQIDRLEWRGIDKIILSSHLQDIDQERALVPQLSGVDLVIGGGGSELLANEGDLLVPGDEDGVFGPYPLEARNADGRSVPIVTTNGDYRYVGRLVVRFDRRGRLTAVDREDSGPVRVSGTGSDAVGPNRQVLRRVTQPVEAAVEELAQNVIGQSEVPLDGTRDAVRSREANLGNLIADALLFKGTELAPEFGVAAPDVALQNGGGIRNNTIIPAGPISELDTFSIAPFSNFVSVVPDVPASQFKELLENAVSNVPGDGRFAQVAGVSFTWSAAGAAQQVSDDGTVTTPGTRVREVTLDDGTAIVRDGAVVGGAPAVGVATNDFSARGGDQYPFRGAPFTTVGVTYQQALRSYIEDGPPALGGTIGGAQYPESGTGRINRLD
jgi:5'-nucleotidase